MPPTTPSASPRAFAARKNKETKMKFEIPPALRLEHDELRNFLGEPLLAGS